MLIEGAAIAIIFFIVKFLEMRFISGETLPLKVLIRETIIVYLASVVGMYTLSQFRQSDLVKNSVLGGGGGASDAAIVGAFTANPDF
jgi:hypothetical protein